MLGAEENWVRLKGLFNITLTPFRSDGELNEPALAENIERVIALGYNGVLIAGTYGEFNAMNTEERAALFRRAADAAADRVPVVMCVAATDMRTVDELLELACSLGGLPMVLPPLISEVNDDLIIAYFARLAARAPRGIVIYNAPRIAVNLRPDLIERLAEIPGVIGIKQGDLSPGAIDDLANRLGGRIRLFCASDLAFLGPISAGFDGLSSTNSCAFPELIQQSYRALEFGDAHLACELHSAWHPFRVLARRFGQPQTTKAAMNVRGFIGGSVRPPLIDLDEEQTDALTEAIGSISVALGQAPRHAQVG